MTSSPYRSRGPGARMSRPLALAALAFLSACSAPPVQPPVPSVPLAVAFTQGQSAQVEDAVPNAAWWAGWGDPTLNALVEEALAANQDVAIALQRVTQA